MVHVVPCHHFVSQDVFVSKQEPYTFCCAQGKIMMATCHNVINIHSLDSRGSILNSFSSVDKVEQMIYCDVGNFIVTLEKRAAKHPKLATCVRVYFNWWMETKSQSVKIHVAGSSIPMLTASTNQPEAVELPLNEEALCIACCKTTAVIGISVGKKVLVYSYCLRSSDNTKPKQHDFSLFIDMELNITVKELDICEGYFACMSDTQVHVFKVTIERENNQNLLIHEKCDSRSVNTTVNQDKNLGEHFIEWKFESCTTDSATDTEWENVLKKNLHQSSFPVTVNFPFIEKINQKSEFSIQNCEIIGPVLTTLGHKIKVKLNPRFFELWPSLASTNIDCVTFLFRQFELTKDQGKLKCLQLTPLFSSDNMAKLDPLHAAIASENSLFSQPWSPLVSQYSSRLKALGCFFSTQKEGFMYDVTREVQLISTYHYTANLKNAIVDTSFLHVLTEAGLETYTSHLPHSAIRRFEKLEGNKNIIYPEKISPVCLLGLRPFLGVSQILTSESYLVLISSFEDADMNAEAPESKNSTVYVLKKPSPQQVFTDLIEICSMYKTSSPSTYQFVLSEGHMILRTNILLNPNPDSDVDALFRKSCILLGDYFACSSNVGDKRLAGPYYHLSKLPFEEVVERLHGLQNQMKHSSGVSKALMLYLSSVLLDESSVEERIVTKSVAEIILDVFMECSPENLWRIIMCSGLQGYKIEKAMLLLKRRITSKRHVATSAGIAADTIAIVSLLLRKGNNEAAQTMLLSLPKNELVSVLDAVPILILEQGSLTSLGKFVKRAFLDAFIEFMYHMVDSGKLKIFEVIDLLQKEDQNVCPEKIPVLKEFLERLWICNRKLFYTNENCEMLLGKILLCSLQESSKCGTANLGAVRAFACGGRSVWLNEMPPFNGQSPSSQCKLMNKKSERDSMENSDCLCWSCNEYLVKLQSILSKKEATEDLKQTVLRSISSTILGYLSLKVLCLSQDKAVNKLLDACPKAFLLYAKETFGNDGEKWRKSFLAVQRKLQQISEDDPLHEMYSEIFDGVLMNMAECLSVSSFISILPPGENKTYARYVKRCCERHQSQQLKNKIVALGNEIKAMM